MNGATIARKLADSFLGIVIVSILIGSVIFFSVRPRKFIPPVSDGDTSGINAGSEDGNTGSGNTDVVSGNEVHDNENGSEEDTDDTSADQPLYDVLEVIDGDTIDIDLAGTRTRIRLIGIDTPETKNSSKPVECFGPEASEFLTSLLSGQKVSIKADPTQDDIDIYGRPLRYVYLDGEDVGLMMVAGGFAREFTFNTPYQQQSMYKAAEKFAETEQIGLWAPNICPDNSGSSETPSAPEPQPQTECLIKGNINKKGEKIYHLPGQSYYDETVISPSKGERYFCTEAEAQAAGWRRAKV